MNNNWKVLPFGEVCELVGGSQPPKSEFIYEPREGYIRLVQVRDYKTDKYETYIPTSKAKKFCNTTDIMIGRYGPPIFGIFSGIEGAYNVALMKAVPNESLLNRNYFRWFLKTHTLVKFVEKTSKRAAGQDGVRKERLYNYEVPIPPLEEQKQIVAILDEAFEAIDQAQANIEKNIDNAKELFQSKLNFVFENILQTSGNSTLGSLLEVLTDYHANGSYKVLKENVELKDDEDYAWMIRSTDFENNFNGKYKYIDEHAYNFLRKSKVYGGDFLISKIGNAGKVYVMPEIDRPCSLAMNLFLLRLKENEMCSDYLYYYFQSSKGEKQILSKLNGATTKTITKASVRELLIPIQTFEEQDKTVETFNNLKIEINQVVENFESKLEKLEDLKKSLLEKAFAGELTHKDMPA